MKNFDAAYWQNRYETEQTGWDVGECSKPLAAFFDSLENKNLKILIPGGGNAHELDYLWKLGFNNIFLLDWANAPLQNVAKRLPDFPKENLICGDFFTHQKEYDLIVEQTFFCALSPNLRSAYVKKMYELLKPDGELAGVFLKQNIEREGPPFPATKTEYETLFSSLFELKKLEDCYNSIQPRMGGELFFRFKKK